MKSIPCILMRGGTSKGPFFRTRDLPADPAERDRTLLAVMGSGNELQIDGVGGGHPLTSKVAMVDRSASPGVDVDYLFAQVSVSQMVVDTAPNCGNMLVAVGPFAIEAGLVPADDPVTLVRIRNVNTGALIDAIVNTPGGRVEYGGSTVIDGVPGSAAPVNIVFRSGAGSKTGALLPTGLAVERIGGVEVTLIDMSVPVLLLRAQSLGKTGYETPAELDADTVFRDRLEAMRREAGRRMGLGEVAGSVVPKVILVAAPRQGGTIAGRYFMPWACHRAFAATGAVCLATASLMHETIAGRMAYWPAAAPSVTCRIEHPAGAIDVELEAAENGTVSRVSLVRTARKLLAGEVFLPEPEMADALP